MDFILWAGKVLVGAFILFTITRKTHETIGQRSGWAWVAMVGALAVANMVVHRLIGNTINPPFFTAVLFGLTVSGLAPKDSPLSIWIKRAIYAIVIGTIIGWMSYAELHHT